MPEFSLKRELLGGVALGAALALLFVRSKRSLSLSMCRNRAAIERFDIDKRFTNSCSYGHIVFMSGQVGVGATIQEQTQSALDEVDRALKAAGSDKSKILEATVWLSDIEKYYQGMNEVYDKWLVPGKPPCRACVEAKLASPNYLVEIRVIAAK